MTRKKYNTEEERIKANLASAKKYYLEHKQDPKFIAKRRAYLNNYYKSLDGTRKEAYRTYQTDYAFFMRNVINGNYEKKILKKENQIKELQKKIIQMKERLSYIQDKFKHLFNYENTK